MISDSKKIEILERELDEKDKQIEELTAEIEELQSVIESYDGVDKAMDELRDAIETSNNCNYDGNIIKNPKAFDLLPCSHGQERMGLRCCIIGAWCWLLYFRC